jgi:ribonuclease P protein subunit RPR2
MSTRGVRPEWQERLARERIEILLGLAVEQSSDLKRSSRYVELARKIGTRYNVRLSAEEKGVFCRKCNAVLIPGKTKQTRLDEKNGAVSIKCTNCNYSYRKRYK